MPPKKRRRNCGTTYLRLSSPCLSGDWTIHKHAHERRNPALALQLQAGEAAEPEPFAAGQKVEHAGAEGEGGGGVAQVLDYDHVAERRDDSAQFGEKFLPR